MPIRVQLEYWNDGPWLVGRLPQVPGVFSQGMTLAELEENIRDACRMMLEEDAYTKTGRTTSPATSVNRKSRP